MVQLKELGGRGQEPWAGQPCKCEHFRKKAGEHTLFAWGNATGFLNQSQSASLRKYRVNFGTFGPKGKLSKLPEHGEKKHQEGKWIPFLVLLWIQGGEEMDPLQRPEHFSCRRLDSPLPHSKVIVDPGAYNQKKLRHNTISSPSPSHLLFPPSKISAPRNIISFSLTRKSYNTVEKTPWQSVLSHEVPMMAQSPLSEMTCPLPLHLKEKLHPRLQKKVLRYPP